MSRRSCVHQIFVRSWSEFCAFTRTFVHPSDFFCVNQTFVRSCPDFRAFSRPYVRSRPDFCAFTRLFLHPLDFCALTRLSCVHVQIFVRSPDLRAFMIKLLCVHQTFPASIRLLCVNQTFVRSCSNFCAFTRPSCVHDQVFVRSPDFSCVHVQTLVRPSAFVG